jgi:hypothetical protein
MAAYSLIQMKTIKKMPTSITDWIMAIGTIVIAGATITYVVVSYKLWSATQASLDLASKSFEIQSRPYVGIEQVLIGTDGTTYRAQPVIKNFGNGIANCIINFRMILDGKELSHLDASFPLFPQATRLLMSSLDEGRMALVRTGAIQLRLEVQVLYSSGGKDYEYSDNFIYNQKEQYFSSSNYKGS